MTDKWAEYKKKHCGCHDASRKNSCKGLATCELPIGHPDRMQNPKPLECDVMTDKIQQARRELFEAWTKSEHGDLTRRQDGEYFDDLTHGAWLGFNAALDCVVIELPFSNDDDLADQIEECRSAIESTNLGIKVK